MGPASASPGRRKTDLGRTVRDALIHLHDYAYLQTHPVASVLLSPAEMRSPRTGRLLHERLVAAIESLRPEGVSSAGSPAARSYELLRLRYVEGCEIAEVCARLGIGESQFHRAHGPSLDAVISLVADCHPALGDASEGPPGENVRRNLPAQLTSFIGREQELAEVAHRLTQARLLTLTGPAGCGKTRLALEAAARLAGSFPDGVWLVELAPFADPTLVAQAVAAVLRVREEQGRPIAETLADAVGHKRLLLILDNCEHLIEASAGVAQVLLANCPGAHLLATSREALGLPGEVRLPVPPLATPRLDRPPALDELLCFAAVQLFVDRATAVVPTFAATAETAGHLTEICARLDGIPLALELAAARLGGMTVAQLAARLDQRFDVLTRGSPAALPRQQTLGALVQWSYDLLREPERRLFERLSVFVGSFSLEAAAIVGDGCRVTGVGNGTRLSSPETRHLTPDTLARLVEKSLVTLEDDGAGGERYRLLETLRQFARAKLVERGEAAEIEASHARHYLAVAEQNAGANWHVANQHRLEADLGNLRAALRWAATSGDVERALWLTGELADFWRVRGYPTEGRAWMNELLAMPTSSTPTVGRGRALCAAAALAWEQNELGEARAYLDTALAIQRAIDDREGVAKTLHGLGMVGLARGAHAAARQSLEEALAIARQFSDPGGVANCLVVLAEIALAERDFERAEELASRALAVTPARRPAMFAVTEDLLGRIALARGDAACARARWIQALSWASQTEFQPSLAVALSRFRDLAAARGDLARAARLAGAATRNHRLGGGAAAAEADRRVLDELRLALGDELYAVAWREGEAMTLTQAIAYALDEERD